MHTVYHCVCVPSYLPDIFACPSCSSFLYVLPWVTANTPRRLFSSKCFPISIIPTLFDVASHSLPFSALQGSFRYLLPISQHLPRLFAPLPLYHLQWVHHKSQSPTVFPNIIRAVYALWRDEVEVNRPGTHKMSP